MPRLRSHTADPMDQPGAGRAAEPRASPPPGASSFLARRFEHGKNRLVGVKESPALYRIVDTVDGGLELELHSGLIRARRQPCGPGQLGGSPFIYRHKGGLVHAPVPDPAGGSADAIPAPIRFRGDHVGRSADCE